MRNLPAYDSAKCAFFSLARGGMYAACRMLGLKNGDRVLSPAYDCDTALEPFKMLGLKVIFYKSDPNTLNADLDDLAGKLSPGTRLIHIINHFGFPQDWDRISEIARKAGIPVLEDNAYSLFSDVGGRPLGTFGDVSVFSLRKVYPIPDGGMLRVNRDDLEDVLRKYTARKGNALSWTRALKYSRPARLLRRRPFIRRCLRRLLSGPESPPPLYSDSGSRPNRPARDKITHEFAADPLKPMSDYSMRVFKEFSGLDHGISLQNIRMGYDFLVSQLGGIKGVRIIRPDAPHGAVPFCLSLILPRKRDVILAELRKKYEVMAWPTLPGAVLDELPSFPEVGALGRGILQLNLSIENAARDDFRLYLESLACDVRKMCARHLTS
ncbi:MAG: DegT/DnrJ/EryC1/StrS family aminotransferase [Candidatus Omnitrophota bacterium]